MIAACEAAMTLQNEKDFQTQDYAERLKLTLLSLYTSILHGNNDHKLPAYEKLIPSF